MNTYKKFGAALLMTWPLLILWAFVGYAMARGTSMSVAEVVGCSFLLAVALPVGAFLSFVSITLGIEQWRR